MCSIKPPPASFAFRHSILSSISTLSSPSARLFRPSPQSFLFSTFPMAALPPTPQTFLCLLIYTLAALWLFCCCEVPRDICKLSRLISHSKCYYLISTEHAENGCHYQRACFLFTHSFFFPPSAFLFLGAWSV